MISAGISAAAEKSTHLEGLEAARKADVEEPVLESAKLSSSGSAAKPKKKHKSKQKERITGENAVPAEREEGFEQPCASLPADKPKKHHKAKHDSKGNEGQPQEKEHSGSVNGGSQEALEKNAQEFRSHKKEGEIEKKNLTSVDSENTQMESAAKKQHEQRGGSKKSDTEKESNRTLIHEEEVGEKDVKDVSESQTINNSEVKDEATKKKKKEKSEKKKAASERRGEEAPLIKASSGQETKKEENFIYEVEKATAMGGDYQESPDRKKKKKEEAEMEARVRQREEEGAASEVKKQHKDEVSRKTASPVQQGMPCDIDNSERKQRPENGGLEAAAKEDDKKTTTTDTRQLLTFSTRMSCCLATVWKTDIVTITHSWKDFVSYAVRRDWVCSAAKP
ncbi:vicilin-like seed storage protein At2g18540 [Cyclospora cayetanensis]|uniref:Vicilin-like seed storage protein At2g18540 n=1 Tax=Cyclospora cayetanensis TaxID=88456 RepID=A0A6P6RS38_9EIME|nr:vicilin-like seed storage protein At2g18540 [Cyclospora cayetanensis]